MADLTFKANLLPNTDLGKALGSSTQRWNIYANLTGNADTAPKWETAKTITIGYKSQDIDGSSNITYDLHDITLSDTILRTTTSWNQTSPGVYGVASGEAFSGEGNPESANGGLAPYRYGQLLVFKAGTYGLAQIYISHHDNDAAYGIKFRSGWNGTYNTAWNTLLDSANYTQYTVTKTGSGASGTWGISISGNAASATALKDRTNSTLTYSNYGASGLAASAITWLTCWNGYELRAISKAEMANAVDSSHKWVRLAGDTMSGKLSIINNSTSANPSGSNIELREYNTLSNTGTHTAAYAPRLGFHWGNRYWCQLALFDSRLRLYGGDFSTYFPFHASSVYGAVWNDYAEMRNVPEANIFEEIENNRNIKLAGRCVRDVGDDTMVLSSDRMQPGCKIISDTFGFNIGETENCKTPIAVSGRVLAYLLEDREIAKEHIGDFVCSGPNGTVSIMTTEEYFKCPQACIGTISAVPDYEEWGTGKVKVDGRIWIYVK